MAVYNSSIVGSLGSSDDITKIKNYIYKLNEDLDYMFKNLTIEDNYSSTAQVRYKEEQDKILSIEESVDGVKIQVEDNAKNYKSSMQLLANLFSLSIETPDESSSVVLTGDKIKLSTGKFVVDSKNLTIDESGNATFSGTVKAASIESSRIQGGTVKGTHITGSTIEVGKFYADDDEVYMGCFYAYEARSGAEYLATQDQTVGMGNHPSYAFWAGSSGDTPPFAVDREGTVYANEIYCGNSWWDNWSLTRILKWLDSRIDDLESA